MDVGANDDEQPPTIEARLKSLFSSSFIPRSSLGVSGSAEVEEANDAPSSNCKNMRNVRRSRLPSPISAGSPRNLHHPKTMSESSESITAPVLRWFGNWAPSESTPSPELEEALNEDCISPGHIPSPHVRTPPKARLPSGSSISSRTFTNHAPPPFFTDLSRATLPTSSVSRPPQLWLPLDSPSAMFHPQDTNSAESKSRDDVEDLETPFIVRDQSPPTSTSIDTLRALSLRDRGMTLPPLEVQTIRPSRSPTRWWSGKENKQTVDNLLHESDQADTIEDEQANIHRKCMSHAIYGYSPL